MKSSILFAFLLLLVSCNNTIRQVNKVTLEFRLAETSPADGLTEYLMKNSNESLYLHPEILITNLDIDSCYADEHLGRNIISIIFNEKGKEKFAKLTGENVGKRVAMLLDSKLIIAPKIMAPITAGRAEISGNFTEEEAEKLAEGIMLK